MNKKHINRTTIPLLSLTIVIPRHQLKKRRAQADASPRIEDGRPGIRDKVTAHHILLLLVVVGVDEGEGEKTGRERGSGERME